MVQGGLWGTYHSFPAKAVSKRFIDLAQPVFVKLLEIVLIEDEIRDRRMIRLVFGHELQIRLGVFAEDTRLDHCFMGFKLPYASGNMFVQCCLEQNPAVLPSRW